MKIPTLSIADPSEEIVSSLTKASCVVVTGITDKAARIKR